MGDLHQIQLVLDRDTVTAAQKQQVEAVAAAATAAAAAEAAGPSGDPGNNGPGFGRGGRPTRRTGWSLGNGGLQEMLRSHMEVCQG